MSSGEHIRTSERREGWAVPIDRIDAFTQGAAMAVDPDQIEKDLAALWRQAAERAQKTGSRLAVARACLWNLVVHVPDGQDVEKAKALLDELSVTVPTRLLVLLERPVGGILGDDTAPLRAYVEANIRQGAGGPREVVSEEITLEAPRAEGRRLPGLVQSLILPDVPTAVFLLDPLRAPAWLLDLAAESQRLIIDTERLATGDLGSLAALLGALREDAGINSPGGAPSIDSAQRSGAPSIDSAQRSGAPSIDSAQRSGAPSVEIADLLWQRLTPWRLLVASLFDPAPAREALGGVEEVTIRYETGGAVAALLLAGWLMARLGWRLERVQGELPQGRYVLSDRDGRAFALNLELAGAGDCAGASPAGVEQVVLRAGEAVFRAGVSGGDRQCVEVEGVAAPRRMQPVHQRSDAEALVAVLNAAGRDPLIYEALCAARPLVHGGAAASAG